jgi:IclR family transcriptional regulator, KDG regulon repressor
MSDTTSSAVERALSILEMVASSNGGMTNSDLSRRLKIPKSSASYILRVMEQRDYLRRDDAGRYKLGFKVLDLTEGAIPSQDVREVAKPILTEFLQKSHLPEAHIAVLDNGRAVYVEKVEGEKSFIKMDIWIGHRLPVHTTAIGKVLVSYLPEEDIRKILETRQMERKTKRSITDPAKFIRETSRVRKYGFAVDDEENAEGVRCVAAPVYDARGEVIAALGTSSVIMHIDEAHMPVIVELVKTAAANVSAEMGYSPKNSPQAAAKTPKARAAAKP